MSALAFLFIVVLISGIGTLVLVMRNRRPTSMESGIDAFRREMDALAPPPDDRQHHPPAPTPRDELD